jgi:predicted nucleic acid-binding protein
LAANKAIDRLRLEGHPLHLVPQNFMELWVVATRPVDQNGLGMSVADVLAEFARLKSFFIVLPETEDVYPAWERLVSAYQVTGKPAHDARLVAAMQVNGIKEILTFDRTGFTRYAGIETVYPADVITAS